MRDNVERWLTHESHSFEFVKNPENSFHILVKHAGEAGVPVEIFEPKKQPGFVVFKTIGTRVYAILYLCALELAPLVIAVQ